MQFRILPIVIIVFLGLVVVKAYQHRGSGDTLDDSESIASSTSDIVDELALEGDGNFVFAEADPMTEANFFEDIEPSAGGEKTLADIDNPDEYKGMTVEEIEEYKRNKRLEEYEGKDLPSNVSRERPEENLPQFTEAQLELLEKLSERRKELDKWENELALKANLLEVSSKKLDEKLSNLEDLKEVTEKLIAEYQNHEQTKLESLVKIYANMKPKDAAKVLNELETEILLEIIDQMSERKAAPILAKMTPERARTVTEELAKQRRIAQEAGVGKRAALQ